MAKIKKFGTFSGVFTPSILTILGVIMYLRFPTILGQVGLINMLAIIVIAHIISFTTSLSVASLSTDKTVKTGGTYFMISRSLGLPIGGTLGLALFVGLSFSVSLYLIGFAESFLTYWKMDTSINSIRITGSIILLIVTTVTFISASLAVKTQYFIMAAMILSLLSIFFGHHEFAPTQINLKPMADAAPFMLLFGIFFPAVTGFEAGVAMSGDLKDAKKSLPLGAMAAVGVGFLVYVILAFFYTFTVDANALKNDNEILFKISLVPALVIIGIWGATLSSALGSILGAPRILQAIAMDKIAPKVFAKGTGKTQEPRNALLLAYVIAQAGILIGELDVIARIVSMFFITTYAFLNLASAIESWSSSDFRPAFKIPRFVSILGALSAFIVMILLDFIALAGAVIVLGLLFFYLSRKELVLESGDAWSSFWTNLAKRALLKLTIEKTETRNWRPNIVLFSGGKQARPYLVELGLAMSGKLGALTDFELVISSNPYLQTDANRNKDKKKEDHFFTRQFVSDSVESGIKTVTNVYGFSGFEPNTIMMGWSRDTKNADFLANVLTHFKKKNLNAVFLDYDKNSGFGKKENVDIWWNGKGRTLSFALNLMRFILADSEWRDARLRILVINNDNKLTDKLYKNTVTLLEEKRISAEVKIINDDFGTRSKEMIINSESKNADLILLGISPKASSYTRQYIEAISKVSELPASLLILSPSDEFEEINIVGTVPKKSTPEIAKQIILELKPIPVLENKLLKLRMETLDEDLFYFVGRFIEKTMNEAVFQQLDLVKKLKDYFEQNCTNLEKSIKELQGEQLSKAVNKLQQAFLAFATSLFEKQGDILLTETKDILHRGLASMNTEVGNYIFETPETIMISVFKKNSKKEKNISVPYRKIISASVHHFLMPDVLKQMQELEKNTVRLFAELKNVILKVNDVYEKWNLKNQDFMSVLSWERDEIFGEFGELEQKLQNLVVESKSHLLHTCRNQVISVCNNLSGDIAKDEIRKLLKLKHHPASESLESFPESWEENSRVLKNAILLDCDVLAKQKIIEGILDNYVDKVRVTVAGNVIGQIDVILKNIDNWMSGNSAKLKGVAFSENAEVRYQFQETYTKIAELIVRLPEEIEITDFSFSDIEEQNISEIIQPVKVEPGKIARYYLDTRLYDPFYRELQQFDKIVNQSIVECREANVLFKFRIENTIRDTGNNFLTENEISEFLVSLKKQILKEKDKLNTAVERIQFKAEEMIKNAVSPLYSHSIIQAEKKISTQLREQKGKKLSLGFSRKAVFLKNKINGLIVNILYSSSGGIIQAQKYLGKKEDYNAGISQILDIAEKEMPNPKIFSQIPVFYKTLFTSKSLINDDFWVPMETEIGGIKDAIQRHKNGNGGAVLIKGVHGSGKTALTRYCATHFFKKDRTFYLGAPPGGSVNTADWLNEVRRATGSNGELHEIFGSLPHESAIIINDLELWWERTNNGCLVLAEIMELIRVFGRKVFFMLNCNNYSFHQMNKVFPMDENFLSIINCSPFDAKKLELLIHRRHKTSGLTYYYRGVEEESVSKVRTASLFNAYYSCSHGIPGVAMNSWLGNIRKVVNQDIYITKPEQPNIDVLGKINPDWFIVIVLFIQHKMMSAVKLSRVLGIAGKEAEALIYNLTNAKILEEKEKDVFILVRYLEPYLVKICVERGII